MFLGYFSVHNLMGVIEEGDKVWEGSKKSSTYAQLEVHFSVVRVLTASRPFLTRQPFFCSLF